MNRRYCGPKLSLCGLLVGIWGIIQLSLMGAAFYFKSVALFETVDAVLEEHYETPKQFYEAADKYYTIFAYNCWIATLVFVLTLIVSGHQFYLNNLERYPLE